MKNLDLGFLANICLTIIPIIIAIFGIYYTRNSFLLTLRQFNKDKKRSEKAIHYYEKYINQPPSHKGNLFLKKIEHDEFIEFVAIPSKFTDFIIKNYPDKFFVLISLLKSSWKSLELVKNGDEEELVCTRKLLRTKQLIYSALYFILGIFSTVLVFIMENRLIKNEIEHIVSSIIITVIFCTLSLFLAFFSLIKATKLSDTIELMKELNKKQKNKYVFFLDILLRVLKNLKNQMSKILK